MRLLKLLMRTSGLPSFATTLIHADSPDSKSGFWSPNSL